MSFLKIDLIWPLIVFSFLLLFFLLRSEKEKSTFIEKTFFKKQTFILKLRGLFFYLGLALLLVSLLDPRGPQEKIESDVQDQKTIIIIDSSASMLAEDIRPNRFKKSLLMARHFIKKAYGHKVAVVLFSDTQKRLVPFTDDLDLLDARVAGLEKLSLYNGGSNISQAIRESLGYFKLDSEDSENITGNLLVFTDSEGHDESFGLELPEKVILAVVGVGTAKGARIPNRDKYGVFRGYKQYNGEEVVSKLNESWLKGLGGKVENFQYWIANSYSIPTEQILTFFNSNFQKRLMRSQVTIRPVLVEYFLIPALVLLTLSFFLYGARSFTSLAVLLILMYFGRSNEVLADEGETVQLEEFIKKGEGGVAAKVKLAEGYLKEEKPELSRILYEEIGVNNLDGKSLNNYALSLMATKELDSALKAWASLQKDYRSGQSSLSQEEYQLVQQNILLALKNKKDEQKSDENDDSKDSEKNQENQQNENQDQNQQGDENQKQNENQGNDQNKDSQGQKKGSDQDPKDGKREQDEDKGGNKKQSDEKEKNQKKSDDKPKTLEEKLDEIRKKRKMVKVPAIIKQIMSDDRNLQEQYLDTTTKESGKSTKKDW